MSTFGTIAIILFVAGIYYIWDEGGPERTERLTKWISKDMTQDEFNRINHNAVSSLWGLTLLSIAIFIVLAGFGLDYGLYCLTVLSLFLGIVLLFLGSFYVKFYIINGNHFRKK